ncbi:unnamed protein product, partial [Arctogadus glacialis]
REEGVLCNSRGAGPSLLRAPGRVGVTAGHTVFTCQLCPATVMAAQCRRKVFVFIPPNPEWHVWEDLQIKPHDCKCKIHSTQTIYCTFKSKLRPAFLFRLFSVNCDTVLIACAATPHPV